MRFAEVKANGNLQVAVLMFAPSPRGLRNPHKNTSTDGSLSFLGEGWGEGEHTAVVVIPFTLRSLLLCHHNTGERARVAHRRYPGDPGSRQENRRFAMPSAFAPG